MERHTPWFQIVAIVLVVIGLIALAAPEPAHAMDPQLILALASAAGAIALIVGYLIVANGREKNKAASLDGVYACRCREASGPRSEEHTSELQSHLNLVCRLLLEKKKESNHT